MFLTFARTKLCLTLKAFRRKIKRKLLSGENSFCFLEMVLYNNDNFLVRTPCSCWECLLRGHILPEKRLRCFPVSLRFYICSFFLASESYSSLQTDLFAQQLCRQRNKQSRAFPALSRGTETVHPGYGWERAQPTGFFC